MNTHTESVAEIDEVPDKVRTPAEIADFFRCSEATVYRLMREGLPYFQLRDGGDRRLDLQDVLDWMEARKASP